MGEFFLAIDIGNTCISYGLFKQGRLLYRWSVATNTDKKVSYYTKQLLKKINSINVCYKKITGIGIASVVPVLNNVFTELCKKIFLCKPLFISSALETGIKILYSKPTQLGSDRLANIVAGYKFLGAPLLIIDFGTATTFDYINKAGEYEGGIIFPGVDLCGKALSDYTAKLPFVKVHRVRNIIGKSTVQCILSGLYYGYIYLVKGLIKQIRKATREEVKIIATGGLAKVFSSQIKEVSRVIPELTLLGIYFLWKKNRQKSKLRIEEN